MNNCYKKNFRLFDWLFFFDLDEFLYLKNYTNFKTYLKTPKFSECKKIHFNWVFHSDNNLLYYDNRSLFERFPKTEKKNKGDISGIKSIIRGHIPFIKIDCQHRLSLKIISCDGFGKKKILFDAITDEPDYENYYINHFYCKSTEEFINKINKGDILLSNNTNWKLAKIRTYFGLNLVTSEKIKYLEKETGFNLSNYTNIIYNYNSNITKS